MQCNIDQRGRKARLYTGLGMLLAGVALLVIGVARGPESFILAGGAVSLVGLFTIFEGLKGWCVVRAMGFKTKM